MCVFCELAALAVGIAAHRTRGLQNALFSSSTAGSATSKPRADGFSPQEGASQQGNEKAAGNAERLL